jgi:predicted RNase H-like HicB family nuclease
MPRKQVARRFKVVFEPEADGSAWNVSIPSVDGCLSYGRSLTEARRNIREALAVSLEDDNRDAIAEGAEFEEEICLPAPVRVAVRRFVKLRAEEAALLVQKANLARVIAEAYSLRDAGELLGMSPEGVRKLVRERHELAHTGTLRREAGQSRTRTLPLQPSANDNVQPKARAGVRRKLQAG